MFPLKLKSDVLITFTHFITTIDVQFSTKIKFILTDGGREFKPPTYFFNTKGIAHRLADPHTHHQNEYVDRKHRHVIKISLTLLAQANILLKFWDHVCLIASYLINKMPTHSLAMQFPYCLIYHLIHDYKFLKAFGCACYPHPKKVMKQSAFKIPQYSFNNNAISIKGLV